MIKPHPTNSEFSEARWKCDKHGILTYHDVSPLDKVDKMNNSFQFICGFCMQEFWLDNIKTKVKFIGFEEPETMTEQEFYKGFTEGEFDEDIV